MIVLGDVFAVIATLVGLFLTGYAMISGLSLLFAARARQAADELICAPRAIALRGFLIGVPSIFLFLVMLGLPNPITKLVGWMGIVLLLTVSMFGASGVAWIMAEKLRLLDANQTPHSAMSRSIMLLLGAALFPVVGWFLFAPVMIFTGLGAGLKVWTSRRQTIAQ